MNVTEFLLARIAEEEAAARTAEESWSSIDLNFSANEDHYPRTTPARVLAECEAKRRIVEDAVADVRDARRRPGWTIPDQEVDELGRRYRAGVEHEKARQLPDTLDRTERLLRLLALPYADHPDFREEWAPVAATSAR